MAFPDYPTQSLIRETILSFTKEGSVVEWADRMALIAGEAGLDISRIDWHGAPFSVANNIAEAATKKFENPAGVINETLSKIKQVQNS